MSEPELVDAYLGGKLSAWGFVRGLVARGVTLGAAVAIAATLPAAATSGNYAALEGVVARTAAQNPNDQKALDRILEHLANGWAIVIRNSNQEPLGQALNNLALNAAGGNANQLEFAFNDNVQRMPVNISGNMNLNANDPNVENWSLNLTGRVGDVPIALNGAMNVNEGHRNNVNLALSGNAGELKVNFNQEK